MSDIQPDQENGENKSNLLLSEETNGIDLLARRGPEPMISVCKFDEEIGDWVVITVNGNAWPALEAQGAVQLIDEDGDGFVTMENGCGIPVDRDDTDPELTDDCNSIPSVTNPETGKTWMDRNLGASRVAESSTDSEAFGDLFQWGRVTDGHQLKTSLTTSALSSADQPGHDDFIITTSSPYDWRSPQNDNLWQGEDGINNPCPCGYRLPTAAEWEEERQSWATNDAAGAFNSPLKLPVSGYRDHSDGLLRFVGEGGNYWSSTVFGTISRLLYFNSLFSAVNESARRADGFAVRCIKD